MTSRERVLAAIAHIEPDRVPVDLGSTTSSGISAIAYSNLKSHIGDLNGHVRVYDVVQQLAQPEDSILDRFGIDSIDIGRTFDTGQTDWYDVQLSDNIGAQYPVWFRPRLNEDGSLEALAPDGVSIARMPVGATFFDQTCFPYLDGYPSDYRGLSKAMRQVMWAGLAHSPWNHAEDEGFWADLRRRAAALRESSDRALVVVCGCSLFEWGAFLRRMDNFLMDIVSEPDDVESLLDALLEQHLAMLEKVCRAVGDIADIIRFSDDLGMDQAPFMPPAIYRKLFKPRHSAICEYVRKHSRMHTYLHSCGSIYQLMPDLIEAGFEIINPIQTSCRQMEPERLKKEFGKDVTFWGGGCDTRNVLNRASLSEVKEHVKKQLEILAPGGGYVFGATHNILPDVPPQNIVAMFEAVREFSG